MTLEQLDLLTGWVALVLTVMVFSYLLRDNFLYRIAVHILVGTAAGYVAIAAVVDVIIPWLEVTAFDEDTDVAVRSLGLLPLVIALGLLLKLLPRYAHIGNFSMLILVGIGTGVALVGAVIGTILPLTAAIGDDVANEEAANALVMVVGTISTLAYFQYISRRRRRDGEPAQLLPIRLLQLVGQGVISLTLGALYALAILTSLAIFDDLLADHIRFLLDRVGG
jgi:hypothetical protein